MRRKERATIMKRGKAEKRCENKKGEREREREK